MMLFFPTVGCLIALIVHAAMKEDAASGLEELIKTADWSSLGSANVHRMHLNVIDFLNDLSVFLGMVLCSNTSLLFN